MQYQIHFRNSPPTNYTIAKMRLIELGGRAFSHYNCFRERNPPKHTKSHEIQETTFLNVEHLSIRTFKCTDDSAD